MRTSSPRRGRAWRHGGFSLLEVLAAMGLLALITTLLMQVRYEAIAKAGTARNYSIATRLGTAMLHRIEAGLMQDVDDGYRGDFSDLEHGEFRYAIGVGDNSNWTGDTSSMDPAEEVLRRFREDQVNADDEEAIKPELTRIFLTIEFPSFRNDGETEEITLETLVPTWAVEQDFSLYRSLWPDLLPTAIN